MQPWSCDMVGNWFLPASQQPQPDESQGEEQRDVAEDPAFLAGGGENHGESPMVARRVKISCTSGSCAIFSHGWLLEKRTKYWFPSRRKP